MDIPIDDGSDKPLGYVTEDGEMEVRDFVDKEGIARRGYCETELGQHQRWLRQAPDLYEKYHDLLHKLALVGAETPQLEAAFKAGYDAGKEAGLEVSSNSCCYDWQYYWRKFSVATAEGSPVGAEKTQEK